MEPGKKVMIGLTIYYLAFQGFVTWYNWGMIISQIGKYLH